jgi:plasmid stabilization system protein ParE
LEAIEDLERVRSFLAEKSMEAAERAKAVIVEHLEKAQRFPTIYRPVSTQRDRREIVIAFGSYGYVIRYQYDREADTVTILRVWHQREKMQ